MQIINWNCSGILSKNLELHNLTNIADIVCFSETKLNKSKNFICPNNFNYLRKDRHDDANGGGLLILVKNNIQFSEISANFSKYGIEVQEIKVFKDNYFINLFNVYIPPNIDSSTLNSMDLIYFLDFWKDFHMSLLWEILMFITYFGAVKY